MTFTARETAAMAAYALDPGHSDLDDEQPLTIVVPPVRRVQQSKRTRENLARAEHRLRDYQRGVRGPYWSHLTGLMLAYGIDANGQEIPLSEAAQYFAFDLSCVLNALGQR